MLWAKTIKSAICSVGKFLWITCRDVCESFGYGHLRGIVPMDYCVEYPQWDAPQIVRFHVKLWRAGQLCGQLVDMCQLSAY